MEPNKNVPYRQSCRRSTYICVRVRCCLPHQTGYTVHETAQSPYGLVVNLNDQANAKQHFYLDDGLTPAPTPNSTLTICAEDQSVSGSLNGSSSPTRPSQMSSCWM